MSQFESNVVEVFVWVYMVYIGLILLSQIRDPLPIYVATLIYIISG